ncbi:hypothetical protein EYC84_011505 [Monilinia fructicola]|uniref:Uncharacterized protein n=1 Tax=Monilinia fructicola TaxID=38448 RepID=A0A5M9J7T7_MONFR|nr:hypothetical protein EYC84_011505 [Monilinia fructicola]
MNYIVAKTSGNGRKPLGKLFRIKKPSERYLSKKKKEKSTSCKMTSLQPCITSIISSIRCYILTIQF